MQNNGKPGILIVEDEKGLRTGIRRLLEQRFKVRTAENGYAGIESGTGEDFDLAIIDLKIPDIDGIQVLKEIKKVHPNTICFIATARASYETAAESARVGAYSYLPKPFTPEELLQQLKPGCDRRVLLLEADTV